MLRRTFQRLATYPILAPVILAFTLTKDSRILDLFYSIRSIPHGILMRNGLRLANYNGIRCLFPSREDPSFDDVFLRNVYYPYVTQPKDVVIDVGAHMGFFTVKVAKKVKEVVAFEPDPYSFRFLSMNIKYNELQNVRAFNYALGDRDACMFLERGYGYGRTRLTESNTGYVCRIKPLDSVVKELGITPTVIKIDTEGHEMKVLEGAKVTLTRCKPKLIIASYHYPDEWKYVTKYLTGMGFRCFIYRVPLALQKAKETYVYSANLDASEPLGS